MKGTCYFCKKEFEKSSMLRHILSCKSMKEYFSKLSDEEGIKEKEVFILSVYPKYDSSLYWLYVSVDTKATLRDIDKFLRDFWLECCGHLSQFKIDGEIYDIDPKGWLDEPFFFGPKPKSMNYKLANVITENMKFDYKYDFGSTTHLELKVLKRQLLPQKKKVVVLAQNIAPIYYCDNCQEKAEYFCYECGEFLCENCVKQHLYHEEMIEKIANGIANSPRNGVCGYGFQDMSSMIEKYLPTE
ncbi:B-box zinc finger [Thermoanaerobacter sp. YS13]|uniref:B-box zinc finger protein n=1 Tax=Thermoanaerobacter sp. YS13 TaxID=1511746 RepID=UPI0005745A34|nr:B-box zinc finger protein [Thermoanaerobacter sp. YS13]KHO63041.1 B-box zinc finger [Thermoanaerobacter sp. YS13]